VSVAPALEAILVKRGDLTPALVVEEATPDDHPLHDRFEWDDAVAGQAYRLVQAERLIRSVQVKVTRVENGEERVIRVRAYLSERELTGSDKDTGKYIPSDRVASDDRLRQMALQSMEREWKAFKRKYSQFAEFAEMVRADLADEAA